MAVAAEAEGRMSYDQIAEVSGLDYTAAAHHVAQLADGRAGNDGAQLLIRDKEPGQRVKFVSLSKQGFSLLQGFLDKDVLPPETAFQQRQRPEVAGFFRTSTLPALQKIDATLPGASLGTVAVLLYIANSLQHFCYEGVPSKLIADDTGVSNLVRHLKLLTLAKPEWPIGPLIKNISDKRRVNPTLTDAGTAFIAEIAGLVLQKEPAPVRKPKDEALLALESPSQIFDLEDGDYEDLQSGPNPDPGADLSQH